MRISVIGSGNWGNRLIKKFNDLCGIYKVYGTQNRVELEKLGIVFENSIERLINESDAVVVATPPCTHFEYAKRVLGHRKHLWIEKPMCLSVDEAKEIVGLVEKSECVAMVDHLLCYWWLIEDTLQVIIRRYGIDTIEYARGIFIKSSTSEKVLNSHWNLGIHLVAIAVHCGIPLDKFNLATSHTGGDNIRFWKRPFPTIGNNAKQFTIKLSGIELKWDIAKSKEDMLARACNNFIDCIPKHLQPLTNCHHGLKVIEAMSQISPNPFI